MNAYWQNYWTNVNDMVNFFYGDLSTEQATANSIDTTILAGKQENAGLCCAQKLLIHPVRFTRCIQQWRTKSCRYYRVQFASSFRWNRTFWYNE